MRNFGYFELLFLLAFVPVVLLVLLAVRRGGPRITTIERRTDDKDRGDA